jgi:hypothetical protein
VTHQVIARTLLAIVCAGQGVGTLAIDLGRAHATNRAWARHARFHVVWQAVGSALLSFFALFVLLAPGPLQETRFYLAAILVSIPMVAFFGALFIMKLYGGALSDPNGILPVKINLFGKVRKIDMNLATEIVAIVMLSAIVILFYE